VTGPARALRTAAILGPWVAVALLIATRPGAPPVRRPVGRTAAAPPGRASVPAPSEPVAESAPADGPRDAGRGAPGLGRLLEEERALGQDGTWTMRRSARLQRRIGALLASDAGSHLELVHRIGAARDADELDRLLAHLLETPFARLVRDGDVSEAIRTRARAWLADPLPRIRRASVEILMRYEPPTRRDFLDCIARLDVEPDPDTREDVLLAIARGARGAAISRHEARPLLDALREGMRSGDAWHAVALAEWSSDESDFAAIRDRLLAETDSTRRQSYLSAFARENRLIDGRRKESEALLLRVLEDVASPETDRLTAAQILIGYAPWSEETARAIRSFHERRESVR